MPVRAGTFVFGVGAADAAWIVLDWAVVRTTSVAIEPDVLGVVAIVIGSNSPPTNDIELIDGSRSFIYVAVCKYSHLLLRLFLSD
jgi:hypothetical protein